MNAQNSTKRINEKISYWNMKGTIFNDVLSIIAVSLIALLKFLGFSGNIAKIICTSFPFK